MIIHYFYNCISENEHLLAFPLYYYLMTLTRHFLPQVWSCQWENVRVLQIT